MHFPTWWLYRIRKCIFHISLVLKRHIPLCTIKKCNLPKATAFLMMLSYKLPTAGSSCSFNYPKDSSLRTCSWNMVVRSRLTWKFFIGGVNIVEKFCGTMVKNSFKEHAERDKHGGMELSEYDYTTHIICLIGLSYYDWLWRKQLPKVLQPATICHWPRQLRRCLFSLKI